MDELIALENDNDRIDTVESELRKQFFFKSIGVPKFILGFRIIWSNNKPVGIGQIMLLEKVLEVMGMSNQNRGDALLMHLSFHKRIIKSYQP